MKNWQTMNHPSTPNNFCLIHMWWIIIKRHFVQFVFISSAAVSMPPNKRHHFQLQLLLWKLYFSYIIESWQNVDSITSCHIADISLQLNGMTFMSTLCNLNSPQHYLVFIHLLVHSKHRKLKGLVGKWLWDDCSRPQNLLHPVETKLNEICTQKKFFSQRSLLNF